MLTAVGTGDCSELKIEWQEKCKQVYYDIRKEKEKLGRPTPNLTGLRNSLFWDTDIPQIDWKKQARGIIKRVFERGDDDEKEEMTRFYGQEKVQSVLQARETKLS